MKRLISLIVLACAALFALTSAAQTADTLLITPSAKSIYIQSTSKAISVTVSNVGGGSDNFFYETGASSRKWQNAESRINYSNVKDVVIAECDENKIKIDFTLENDDKVSYSFGIPDPENRFVNTYIGRKGSDFGITFKKAGNTKWDLISGGWGIGWVAPINDSPAMNANMWKSNELTWAIVLGVKMTHGRNSLATGLGIDWRNYVTKGDRYFHKTDDGTITLMPYESGSNKHRSRIKTFSLQIPLLYGIAFGHHNNCQFNLGPILNFNTGGSIKTQYKLDGRDYSVKTSHIGQRPVTVDIFGQFKYKAVGIYVRYSPMSVLKTSTGLDFKSISTGIIIGL